VTNCPETAKNIYGKERYGRNLLRPIELFNGIPIKVREMTKESSILLSLPEMRISNLAVVEESGFH
jgi:hypothetical protein